MTRPLPQDHQLRPRRTVLSNTCWELQGGNEDNYLWAYTTDGQVRSTFVPTDEQRAFIFAGGNIDLIVWGRQPPVALVCSNTPLGAKPCAP